MYDTSLGLDVESTLAKIEGTAALVIKRIIKTGLPPKPLSKEYFRFLFFVISLWGRTPAAGRELTARTTQAARAYIKGDPEAPDELKESIDKVVVKPREPITASLALAIKDVRYFLDLGLSIIRNESEAEFITSDAPVVLFNQWCQEATERGAIGFIQSGLQVFLPLSPHCLFLLCDRSIYKIGKRNQSPVVVTKEEDIEQINALQLITAEENLYYSSPNKTEKRIEQLPLKKRRRRAEKIVTKYSIDNSRKSTLICTFEKPFDIKLNTSFIKIMRRKRKIPLGDRLSSFREGPKELYYAQEGSDEDLINLVSKTREWHVIDE